MYICLDRVSRADVQTAPVRADKSLMSRPRMAPRDPTIYPSVAPVQPELVVPRSRHSLGTVCHLVICV